MNTKKVIMQSDGFQVLLAKKFSNAAASFESEIRIHWVEKNIISDGKSILGLMALELKKGTAIMLMAEGSDEEHAIEELASIIETGI